MLKAQPLKGHEYNGNRIATSTSWKDVCKSFALAGKVGRSRKWSANFWQHISHSSSSKAPAGVESGAKTKQISSGSLSEAEVLSSLLWSGRLE